MSLHSWPKFLRSPGVPLPQQGYSKTSDHFSEGNHLTLLHDGRQAYPAMLKAIAQARSTIHLETYILQSDDTGEKFARALAERARAGIAVRVVFDSVGSLDIAGDFLQFLRNSGAMILEYRPLAPWRQRWGWSRRDHRKILVVDSRIGFTGGLNIADEHADPAEGGGGWRDSHVRIEGPAAHELDQMFRAVWFRETGRWFNLPETPLHQAGGSLVHLAANQEFLDRHRIRRSYLHAIKRAERSILIANAYFIPDRGIRRALYRARRRGVSVDILVPEISDVPTVSYASRFLFETHLEQGLRLHAWSGPVLHAKSVTIDRIWSAVGSYNMDHRSWLHNLELNLHILDERFAMELEDSLRRDIACSREITLPEWRRRPCPDKVLERLAFLLRYWL